MSPKPNENWNSKKPNGSECGADHKPGNSRKIACREKNNTGHRLRIWPCAAEIRNSPRRRGANQDRFDDSVAKRQQRIVVNGQQEEIEIGGCANR
jgi:hypothetical protein